MTRRIPPPVVGGSTGSSALAQVGLHLHCEIAASDRYTEDPVSGLALVDTGATNCAILASAAKQLQLTVVATRDIRGWGGLIKDAPIYLVTISFGGLGVVPLDRIPATVISELPYGAVAIIGRNALQRGRLMWDGRTGNCEIEFDPAPIRDMEPGDTTG